MCAEDRPEVAAAAARAAGSFLLNIKHVRPPPPQSTRLLTLLVDLALAVYAIGFLFFRVGELVPLLATNPAECANNFAALTSGVTALLTMGYGYSDAGNVFKLRHVLAVITFAALIYAMDHHLPISPPDIESGGGQQAAVRTVVITGANSGIGFETARALVARGVTVIMGCRSMERCGDAADRINDDGTTNNGKKGRAVPLLLDLSDFKSVHTFATRGLKGLNLDEPTVDVLFNNGGYVPPLGQPVNARGLNPAFAAMHLSHHLLTELILRHNNPSLRVVNTSSGTHHLCAIPFALLPPAVLNMLPKAILPQNPGCIDENFLAEGVRSPTDGAAYVQAKVANVMHVAELPRRHSSTAPAAVAIDLGWVGTSIQPFMRGALTPALLGWMRSGAVGVRPVLNAILRPLEELGRVDGDSSSGGGGDRDGTTTTAATRDWAEQGGVVMNVFGTVEEPFSYSQWWTEGGRSGYNLGRDRMEELGRKLWEETTKILRKNGYKTVR